MFDVQNVQTLVSLTALQQLKIFSIALGPPPAGDPAVMPFLEDLDIQGSTNCLPDILAAATLPALKILSICTQQGRINPESQLDCTSRLTALERLSLYSPEQSTLDASALRLSALPRLTSLHTMHIPLLLATLEGGTALEHLQLEIDCALLNEEVVAAVAALPCLRQLTAYREHAAFEEQDDLRPLLHLGQLQHALEVRGCQIEIVTLDDLYWILTGEIPLSHQTSA